MDWHSEGTTAVQQTTVCTGPYAEAEGLQTMLLQLCYTRGFEKRE